LIRSLVLSAFVFFVFSTSAHALSLTVGGSSCLTCDGSEITLDIVDNGGTFDVKLTFDSTHYDESREGLAQVGFGAIKNWTSVLLVSSPAAQIAWSAPVHANVDSAGMCGATNGNSGKICTFGFTDIRTNGLYTWEFEVTGGTLKLDTDDWHIGGQYASYADLTDDSDKTPNGKLISESGGAPPVPEPTAALVFAAGLLVTRVGVRRRA